MAVVDNLNVEIGRLNTPIEIQRFEHRIDKHGFNVHDWTVIARPRCLIQFDDGVRQIIRDDGVDATNVKLFTMRYIPDITTKDRIVYNNRNYEIYSVHVINEERRFMRLWGREIEPTS